MGELSIVSSSKDITDFHAINRKLFAVLVLQLSLNPSKAMKIMAFWLCLERLGFRNTINTILSLPIFRISQIADEAVTCLNYLTTSNVLSSPQVSHIPLTKCLINDKISLKFLYENRRSVIMHLTEVRYEVCHLSLMDIAQEAEKRNAARSSAEMDRIIASLPDADSLIGGDELLTLPQVHPDDRTLFVTFSRGYPVAVEEMRDFFTGLYGDCIESVYMQQVKPGEQSLYARVVLHSPSIIEDILLGKGKVESTINGKHAWMRKFVPKNKRAPTVEKGLLRCPKVQLA